METLKASYIHALVPLTLPTAHSEMTIFPKIYPGLELLQPHSQEPALDMTEKGASVRTTKKLQMVAL